MASHLTYDVLNRLIDDRASAIERGRAERHLKGCGRCRSEREWLERVRKAPHPPGGAPDRQAIPGAWAH